MFSIFLSDFYSDDGRSSNIIFGGYNLEAFAANPNSKFEFLKVNKASGYWRISLNFAEINGNVFKTNVKFAILDMTMPLIYVDLEFLYKIIKEIRRVTSC